MRKTPIRRSGFSADNIPPEILTGIGELIAHWSYIEFQLGVLIREGFNLSMPTGRVFTVGAGIKVECAALKTMTHDATWIQDEPLRKDIAKLADKVTRQAKNRHDYAHGVFGFSVNEPGTLVRFKTKDKEHRINPEQEKVTAEALKKLCDEAHNFGVDAQDLTVRLKRWKQSAGLRRPVR